MTTRHSVETWDFLYKRACALSSYAINLCSFEASILRFPKHAATVIAIVIAIVIVIVLVLVLVLVLVRVIVIVIVIVIEIVIVIVKVI